MKKLVYTASVAVLTAFTLSMTSSTHADETKEMKRAASIEYFYRATSITSFKDYRDIKKEAEAKKAAEEKKAEEEKKAAEEAAKKAEEEAKKKAAEEAAAKKAEEEKKAAEEAKNAAEEARRAAEQAKKAEEFSPEDSTSYAAVQTSTERLYNLSDFMFSGVVYWSGYKFTYYSQSVLPGGGLLIPGRHVNADGYVSDGDGYIVLAGSAPMGTVYDTPFGYKGKIYDRGTYGNHLDVYIR